MSNSESHDFHLETRNDHEAALRARVHESNQPVTDAIMSGNHVNDNSIPMQHQNTPVDENNVDQAAPIALFVAAEAAIQALNGEDREDDDGNESDNETNRNMNHGTIFEGIYVPTTVNGRRALVE